MKRAKRDPVREDRIHNEAIVDARPDEQAMGWYYYLEGNITFPFRARCIAANGVSPLRKDETVEVLGVFALHEVNRVAKRLPLMVPVGKFADLLGDSLGRSSVLRRFGHGKLAGKAVGNHLK